MIQLAIADVFALICISLGTIFFTLCPNIYESHPHLENWFAFALNLGWHPGCCFFCFIAYSRFLTLCKNDQLSIYFSKRRVQISICLSWLIFGGIYSMQFVPREHFGRLTRMRTDH
uniref:Vomeronasal type-1 receptor n=1 Tax=Romanomermis culicivorax TaxID=13658 RepID=A0A915JYN7_ROMCU